MSLGFQCIFCFMTLSLSISSLERYICPNHLIHHINPYKNIPHHTTYHSQTQTHAANQSIRVILGISEGMLLGSIQKTSTAIMPDLQDSGRNGMNSGFEVTLSCELIKRILPKASLSCHSWWLGTWCEKCGVNLQVYFTIFDPFTKFTQI